MFFEVALRRSGVLVPHSQIISPLFSRTPNSCSVISCRTYKKMPSKPKPFPSKLQDWRREQKMPVNPTWRGVLTDGPDFSYTDGQPAPALVNQVRRADKQRRLMERVVQLTSELDLAERLHAERVASAERQRQQLAGSRLKAKANKPLDTA
ncbi:39S ribosomal protein L52, mitochondrial-like [Amphibalanus amphitrite]|uniref:39S ribosomal protein L52, mitochondrial-like n=1 Tax=Amphibalanus amphitrite TaxID=1232801 RepID=UPI001C8FFC5E|nr:39S ribosomal protein L52, mitochondrial-like [Amphibalanus amphitrite]XP_043227880.1 39S ribosomal protein L52, mitochondrial-like [Amphibalanus amphitrite]XP_043227881.1 39S ribosomal protein L52, mitochondrial-like [Amphibalanus amphitrite]XP_043227882.1 39S ribosomal protein L52, mitochondrial-like [Amphibalanus amphitrite]